MPEETPQRLREFREAGVEAALRSLRRQVRALSLLLVLGFGLTGALLGRLMVTEGAGGPQGGGLREEALREFAAHLVKEGRHEAALRVYDEYLEHAALARPKRAALCYAVAEVAIEAGKHERALDYLYEAEFLDPNSELSAEISKKIVACLEETGSPVARAALQERTVMAAPEAGDEDAEAGAQ